MLVIEDNVIAADGLRMALEACGLEVDVVHDAESAAAAIDRLRPDVVILDLILRGTSGIDLLRTLQATRPGLPVIVTTGHPAFEGLDSSMLRSNVDFLRKPYPLEQLLATIRRLTTNPSRSASTEGRVRP